MVCCLLQISNSDKTKFVFIFVESARDLDVTRLVLTAFLRLQLLNFRSWIPEHTLNIFSNVHAFMSSLYYNTARSSAKRRVIRKWLKWSQSFLWYDQLANQFVTKQSQLIWNGMFRNFLLKNFLAKFFCISLGIVNVWGHATATRECGHISVNVHLLNCCFLNTRTFYWMQMYLLSGLVISNNM